MVLVPKAWEALVVFVFPSGSGKLQRGVLIYVGTRRKGRCARAQATRIQAKPRVPGGGPGVI